MKVITLLTALAITPIALAHPDHQPEHPDHPSDHPEHPSDHPEHPSETVDNNEAMEEATALLKKVHDNYKKASGIVEVVTITMPSMMGGDETDTMTLDLMIDSNTGSIIVEDQLSAVWKEGKVYVTLNDLDEAYIETDAKTFNGGIDTATGGNGTPAWTLVLRESDNSDDWFDAFSMGMPGVQVAGVSKDGDASVIQMTTLMGTIDIFVTNTNTIDKVVMGISQPGMPTMEVTAVADLKFVKSIPSVSFDAGDRKKYDSMEAIFAEMEEEEASGEAGLVGKTAPDFTLTTLAGDEVTLSDLKGEVVILDFWATWCGPCKLGLPLLNEFDTWAQEQGLKVKVFALNVWEGEDAAVVKKTVEKFWTDKKYNTSVLLGSGDKALPKNYGVTGIPATFVIGIDGTVLESHIGYDKNMVETLKKSVADALEGGAKKPDHPDHPDHPGS